MLKKISEPSSFTRELFHSNEVKNNKLAASSVLLLGILYVVIAIFFHVEDYDLVTRKLEIILFSIGIADFLVALVAAVLRFDNKILRGLLIVSIILSSGTFYFFYPTTAYFVTYGPLVISALYYDKKLIRRIAAFGYFFVTLFLWLNVYLENHNTFMNELHNSMVAVIWKYPRDVLLYQFVPHTITYVITFLICMGIARKGNDMIIKNAEESSRNAVIETELSAASDIQRSSLPPDEFSDGSLQINSVMKPAKIVGGDFYDYFYLGNNIVILVADVSDKGMPAAMFMMKAKNAIRSEIKYGKTLEDSVFSVNNILNRDNNENMFVTLWVAIINKNTGVGKYVNCGHSSPLIKHKDGTVSKLYDEPNTVLGVFEDFKFTSNVLSFSQDDTILLFTDGLTDSINDKEEFFGEEGLTNIFAKSGNDICEALMNRINAFSNGAEQFDDITALALTLKNVETVASEKITLTTDYDSVEKFLDIINGRLEGILCPNETRQNINVVVDELCSNIIDHAKQTSFDIEYQAGENFLVMTFTDNGFPFDPTTHQTEISDNIVQVGGFGIYIVKNLVDEISYVRENDKNYLTVKIVF